MKKNTWIILGVIAVVAIIGSLFATGMFSVAGFGNRLGYRLEPYPCGRSNTWQVDDYKIVYNTHEVDANTIRPGNKLGVNNYCVPENVKYYEDNQLLFEYDVDSGFTESVSMTLDDSNIQDPTYYTQDGDVRVILGRGKYMDEGEVYPGNIIAEIDIYFEGGVARLGLDNDGWHSNGETTGSDMTFYFNGNKVNFTVDFEKDQEEVLNGGEPLVATITNNQDFKFGARICRQYGVDGLFGKVTEIDCDDSVTMFDDGESKEVSYDLPSPNETDLKEYEVRVVLQDAFVRFDNIDPAYGEHASYDESKLRNGNEFTIGTAYTQWEPVSLLTEYQEEIDSLEGNLTAQLDYIDSLETDYETKADLVKSLDMKVSELRDAIESLEASQEQKEETISEYEEELQQSKTVNYILYVVLGVLIIVAGIVGYRIRKK